jgi:hypothetical protein
MCFAVSGLNHTEKAPHATVKSNYKSKEWFGNILKFATGSKYTSTSTAYTTGRFQRQNKKRVHWQNHSLFSINI